MMKIENIWYAENAHFVNKNTTFLYEDWGFIVIRRQNNCLYLKFKGDKISKTLKIDSIKLLAQKPGLSSDIFMFGGCFLYLIGVIMFTKYEDDFLKVFLNIVFLAFSLLGPILLFRFKEKSSWIEISGFADEGKLEKVYLFDARGFGGGWLGVFGGTKNIYNEIFDMWVQTWQIGG